MVRYPVLMFLVLVFLGGVPGSAPVILAGPAVTQIDVPGATATFANGINDAGQIVGVYEDAADAGHGFVAAGVTP